MLWLVILLRSYLGLTKLPLIDNCMKILFLDLIMNEFVLIIICTVDGFQSISVEDKFFMVFVYHWILLTGEYVLGIVIQQLNIWLLCSCHLETRSNVDAREFLLAGRVLLSYWLPALQYIDVEYVQGIFWLMYITGGVIESPILAWCTGSRSGPWAIAGEHRAGWYGRLPQWEASWGLDLKWLLVLELIDVVVLRTDRVLATHLEILPRRTHPHLNSVFVFGVFVFSANSF
jgi:hypothetical protein